MSVHILQKDTQTALYETCGRGLEGLRCRVAELFAAVTRGFRTRRALSEFQRLSAHQLEDIGFDDPERQVRVLGRRLDLGQIDRDPGRYALLGDRSRRL